MSILNAIAQGTNPGAGMVQGRKNQLAMEDRERSYNMAKTNQNRLAENDAFNRQWKMDERDYNRKQNTLQSKAKAREDAAEWVKQLKHDIMKGVLPPDAVEGYAQTWFETGRGMGLDLPESVPPNALKALTDLAAGSYKPQKPDLMTGVDGQGNPVMVPKVEGATPFIKPDNNKVNLVQVFSEDGMTPEFVPQSEALERKPYSDAQAKKMDEKRKTAQASKKVQSIAQDLLKDKDSVRAVYGAIDSWTPTLRSKSKTTEIKLQQLISNLTLADTDKLTGILSDTDIALLKAGATPLSDLSLDDETAIQALEALAGDPNTVTVGNATITFKD
jgi:hypothetical protein